MAEDPPQENLLCISFTQDSRAISVGHKDGYILYRTMDISDSSILPYEGEMSSIPTMKDVVVLERLFLSSLMCLVSQKDPRVMHVCHFASKNSICDYKFNKSILNIKMNRDRIVVCLEDMIMIYNLKDMKLMHNIVDTPLNRLGIIDLSSETKTALLAYPGNNETGSIHIFDAMNLTSVNTFVAHEGTLAAIKFNPNGTMLATASTKGTVIRVYSVPQGNRLFEFRRGVARCVTIYSLAFSSDSAYLCSSSNTETVHVFKLEKTEEPVNNEATTEATSSWYDVFTRTASAYMPTQVSDLISVERSFATAKLPNSEKRNVVALVTLKGQQHVVVATYDGYLYCYRLDAAGGELDLVKQHRIGPNAEGAKAKPRPTSESGVPNMDDPDNFPPMIHTSS
ncbi:unnamed protein product [Caenorhabditis auriculariae]|uniref:WD repeat domain phosphoinositide-interacting protein 2 n=1 Tax=Caenorhabditis auriculariae TaxID=2777116 RepID=A0A8S1HVE9_9PELO|nr:unnamed protein product [Caenorhabditis auriculariae]